MITALLILSVAAVAQVEGPVQTPAKEVAKLLLQLNAKTAAERDAAEKRLLEMGPKILPLLPDAASVSVPEVMVRLARIRNQLEKEGAVNTMERVVGRPN